MSKYITPIRVSNAVAIGLGVMAIALMGVVIHLKTTESNCDANTVFEKYRHVFRSEDEQKKIEDQIPAELIYNACCNSSTRFIRPNSALTLSNVNVTILQNVSSSFQYFPVETCSETPSDCTCACKCRLRYTYFSALVRYPPPEKTLNFSLIRLLAICKCINNIP